MSGFLTEPLGRKIALICVNIPYVVAWILLYYAKSLMAIYISFSLLGVGLGSNFYFFFLFLILETKSMFKLQVLWKRQFLRKFFDFSNLFYGGNFSDISNEFFMIIFLVSQSP